MEELERAKDALRDLIDIYISAADECHQDGDISGYDYYLTRVFEVMREHYRIQRDIDILRKEKEK